jgi:hypothetical protein
LLFKVGSEKKKGVTSLVKLLDGGTATDDVVPLAAVDTFEFGMLQAVGN